MKILFLSLADFDSLNVSNIYTDVISELVSDGHFVSVISPMEKRNWREVDLIRGNNYTILKPQIGNISDTPFIEKGFSIFGFKKQIVNCIKKNISSIDLMVAAVPPLTVDSVIKFVKKRYDAKSYLLLKDIWPDSLLDLNIRPFFLKKMAFLILRKIEKRLYKTSDFIGCLSKANVDYLLKRNKYLDPYKVHVNPNSIRSTKIEQISQNDIDSIKDVYLLPKNKKIFVYGGTLGVGQGINHIIDCLNATKNMFCHFIICGNGVGYDKLKTFCSTNHIYNVTLLHKLPYEEYKKILEVADVGLLFLRYTAKTPNIPSRLLSYMNFALPVLSCTDPVTDLPLIISEGSFGWSCLSDNPVVFANLVGKIISYPRDILKNMGINGKNYLEKNFVSTISKNIILDSFKNNCKKSN